MVSSGVCENLSAYPLMSCAISSARISRLSSKGISPFVSSSHFLSNLSRRSVFPIHLLYPVTDNIYRQLPVADIAVVLGIFLVGEEAESK